MRYLIGLTISFLILVSAAVMPAAAESSKYAALVVNAETGAILHQRNASAQRYPASLTKMMTLYLTFDALEKGQLKMNTYLRASDRAASQPPLGLDMREGQQISVRDAINALVVKSANDVAVVLAEGVGGSEWQFARMMTAKARELGMSNTTFMNASGLHNPQQVTTAVDLAKLAIALQRDFPQYYPMMSTLRFTYKGVKYETHNRVTKNYPGATGGKTGYVNASGFNLVTTAKRGGTNLVGVVLGGVTYKKRDVQMVSLLNNAFARAGGATTSVAAKAPAAQTTKQLAQAAPAAAPIAQVAKAKEQPVSNKRVVARKMEKLEKTSYRTNKKGKNVRNESAAKLPRNWAVQVGQFRKEQQANAAVNRAKSIAGKHLEESKVSVSRSGSKGKVHTAKLANLTESEARSTCNALRAAQSACRVVRFN